jgi:maleylacetoacetate isomerase
LKGINYEYKAVNLLKGDQKKPEYLKVNPMGAIPALVIDGHTLCESVAICEYLEETRPTPALLPKEPTKRAKVRQVVETIAGDIQPIQNMRVLNKVAEWAGGDQRKPEWAAHFIDIGFQGWFDDCDDDDDVLCAGQFFYDLSSSSSYFFLLFLFSVGTYLEGFCWQILCW